MRKFNRIGQRGKGHFLAISETKFGPLLAKNSTFLLRRTWGYVVQHYRQKRCPRTQGRESPKKAKKVHFFLDFLIFCDICALVLSGLFGPAIWAYGHLEATWEKLHFGHFGLRIREQNHRSWHLQIASWNEVTIRGSEPPFSCSQAKMTWVSQGNSLKIVLVLVLVLILLVLERGMAHPSPLSTKWPVTYRIIVE